MTRGPDRPGPQRISGFTGRRCGLEAMLDRLGPPSWRARHRIEVARPLSGLGESERLPHRRAGIQVIAHDQPVALDQRGHLERVACRQAERCLVFEVVPAVRPLQVAGPEGAEPGPAEMAADMLLLLVKGQLREGGEVSRTVLEAPDGSNSACLLSR